MPRVRWGISSNVIEDFDRSTQFAPYKGPIPPNGVYLWNLKILKYVAGTKEKHPQLRIGLELVPRSEHDEKRFKGYFIMAFRVITENSAMFYVPFLDAIGVSATDFTERTITDEEGNIKKIGRWRNDGKQTILAQLKDEQDQNGDPRKGIGWMGPEEDSEPDDWQESDEEYEGEEYEEEYEEEQEEEEDEEESPPRSRKSKQRGSSKSAGAARGSGSTRNTGNAAKRTKSTSRSRRVSDDDAF